MTNWNWHKLSSGAAMRLLSVALTLAVTSFAEQALALGRGDSGSQVTNVQRCLQKLGYYNGPINGNFGPLTENAVKKFQQAKKISVIGQVGPQTQRSLQAACQSQQSRGNTSSSNVLKVGTRGSAVTQLQKSLRTLGYFNGPVTGYFGQETQQAVIRFQQSQRLQADGVAGGNTLQVIRTNLASRSNNAVGGGVDNYPNAWNEGDAGSQVLQLQRNLAKLGYFQATPTGNFGSVTKNAVVRFQRDNGLTANGIVDGQTWTAIATNANYVNPVNPNNSNVNNSNLNNSGCSPTSGFICLGENSPRVVAVQQSLRQQGLFNRDINGYYGTETRDAVAQFQQTAKLNPTGVVDFQTWQALGLTNSNPTGVQNSKVENRYVVIVPIRDANTLDQVRQFVPQAFTMRSNLGEYVNAGAFRDRSEAEKRSSQLRDRGFDARVEYF